jgi:hypothetical protein
MSGRPDIAIQDPHAAAVPNCLEPGIVNSLPAMQMLQTVLPIDRCGAFPNPGTPAAREFAATKSSSPRTLLVAALLLAGIAPCAQAEGGNPLTDRFSFSLGTFLLNTSTEIRVDGQAGRGDEINLERDLGVRDADRFRIDGYWRMTPRQKLRIMYFDTSNSANKVLERDIHFGDNIYPVSAEVKASSQTTVFELAYEFAFLHTDKYELTVTGGVHNLKFETALSVQSGGQAAGISNSAQADGPLPVIGVHGVWLMGDKFYFDAAAQFFKININPYDGSVSDYNASFVWRAFKNVGFGAGFNEFVTKVDVNGNNFDGSLRWRYGGARIFVTASF